MGLTPVVLLEMLIDDLFDLYIDLIIFKRRTNQETDDNSATYSNVKTITRPAPISIKDGGWY